MGRPLLRDEVPVGPCKVRALFSWSGETPQDLGFVEGDIIEVLNNGDGDWWTGKLKRNKLVGVFPRNLAEYVDENQETMSAALSGKKHKKLMNYSLESGGESIDFTSFSLADLQIPDFNANTPSAATVSPDESVAPLATLDPKSSTNSAYTDHKDILRWSKSDPEAQARSLVPSPADPLAESHNSHRSVRSHRGKLSPLNESANSNKSSKSAKEILDDIAQELNGGFLDDINLDSHPEDLRTPELVNEGFEIPSFDFQNMSKGFKRHDLSDDLVLPDPDDSHPSIIHNDHSETSHYSGDHMPVPPPHRVSVNSRKSAHSRASSHVPEDPVNISISTTKATASPPRAKQTAAATASAGTSSALTGPALGHSERKFASHTQKPANEPIDLASFQTPVDRSPTLDQEIPFDPKAFQTESSIGDHIGSHFDSTSFANNLGKPANAGSTAGGSALTGPVLARDESNHDTMTVRRTRRPAQAYQDENDRTAETAKPSTVFYPQKEESKKSNFFQKLFPKNSQTFLKRSFSRSSQKSSKSSKSTKSTVTSKLKNMKSKFSFNFTPDDSLYPTNKLNDFGPVNSTLADGPMPAVKRIETPPRANLNGLGLTSPLSRSPLRASKDNHLLHPSTSASFGGATSTNMAGSSNSKEPLAGKWIETRRDLYRAKTLMARDVQKRRQELELQGINSENLIETLNHQNAEDFHDYRLEEFEEVDVAVRNMSTWPQLMTPSVFASSRIGRHFNDPVDRIRAVFLLCALRIQHVALTPPGNNVMQTQLATPQEIAHTIAAMCSALDIECVVIEGHKRGINATSQSITNEPHTWNGVNINGEWRLLDAVTAAASSSAQAGLSGLLDSEEDEEFVNLFYFLTPPAQLIYSHVPSDHRRQFCEPSLPTANAALLPLASPAAFAHNICFDTFWLGMTRLSDLEVAELSLSVPDSSKDLVAVIDGQQQRALAQAYWNESDNTRHFRVKAFVPPHIKQTTMHIYVVSKTQSSRNLEDMELIWSVELRHVSGEKNNSPFEFVGRYAVPAASDYDLYVSEPQCRSLGGGDTYTFKIESFDANGGKLSLNKKTPQPRVAMQSPSGRLTRLVPFGTDVHDMFKATVKTLEVGTWRAVVRADEEHSWAPFAEWFCS